MSKRSQTAAPPDPPDGRACGQAARRRRALVWGLILVLGAMGAVMSLNFLLSRRHDTSTQPSPREPTFNKDIAPIIFGRCSPCHQPGQSAPFALLTYADVRKRAKEIADVTTRRLMPPWPPEPGDAEFVGQRRLSEAQIALIGRWVARGAAEGKPGDAPLAPSVRRGWQLGEPDLVVQMPRPYTLAADGPDVYRNFVIPLPNPPARPKPLRRGEGPARRFVRALEFQPGNARIVHHAFLRFDATRESRRLDEKDSEPGFGGLHTPITAQAPEGHFLSWQPGKIPLPEPAGLAWTLETNWDLVLQTHLRPSGKSESLQCSVAFYFTDAPPTNTALKIGMMHFAIDIPPGATAHEVRDTIPIGADVDLLGVLPHAHYLARTAHAWATLPDGTTRWLIRINDWDFNWQGEYNYLHPVFLPAGSTVSMRYTYDNSTNNVRNPHQPPRRVRYGLNADDEMAELWLKVLPRRTNDLPVLARAYQPRVFDEVIAYNRYLLEKDPNDARAHTEIGKSLIFRGQHAAAEVELRAALKLRSDFDEPHYFLGLSFRLQDRLAEAQAEFAAAVRLNPGNAKAHGNLGLVLLELGRLKEAESSLRQALQLNPQDNLAREGLADIARARAAGREKDQPD